MKNEKTLVLSSYRIPISLFAILFISILFSRSGIASQEYKLHIFSNVHSDSIFEFGAKKTIFTDYQLKLSYGEFADNFGGRAGRDFCLVFCFKLPFNQKYLEVKSTTLQFQKELSVYGNDFIAGAGLGYDTVSARNATSSTDSGVNTSYPKIIASIATELPLEFRELLFIPSLELAYFQKSNAEVLNYKLDLSFVYSMSKETSVGLGYRHYMIDFDFKDKETIIELRGEKSFPYLTLNYFWL